MMEPERSDQAVALVELEGGVAPATACRNASSHRNRTVHCPSEKPDGADAEQGEDGGTPGGITFVPADAAGRQYTTRSASIPYGKLGAYIVYYTTDPYRKTMSPKQTKKPTRSPAVKQPGTGHPARCTSLSPDWEQRLKELEAFKKEHGHCNVPRKYPPNIPLAHWVTGVRRRKRSGTIAAELASRLDELGFTWVLRRRTVYRWDWDAMVAALAAFKNQHGHFRVPLRPAKHRELGWWLIQVRSRRRKGLLDRGRIRQLDRLGVVWEPNNQKWEDRFADLVAYRAQYGDCNVPGNWSENQRLASWVHSQRRSQKLNTLTQDRFERLDKIGFSWTRVKELWESKYAALVEYQQAHGHCGVSTLSKDHASLGRWVARMRVHRRRGELSKERIRRLTQLGFVWDGRQERGTRD